MSNKRKSRKSSSGTPNTSGIKRAGSGSAGKKAVANKPALVKSPASIPSGTKPLVSNSSVQSAAPGSSRIPKTLNIQYVQVDPECTDKDVFYYHDLSGFYKKPEDRINMRLARISDKDMFQGSTSPGSHIYCVYKDPKTKHDRAVETTHLFVPDGKRFEQIDNNELYKTYFPGFHSCSGVFPYSVNKYADGSYIDLSDKSKVRYLDSRFYVPEAQAEHILAQSHRCVGKCPSFPSTNQNYNTSSKQGSNTSNKRPTP